MKPALIVSVLTFACLGLRCAGATPEAASQPLFGSDEALSFRLEAPFAVLQNQSDDDPEWLEGRLVLTEPGSADRVFSVEVKARGQFRRKSGECDFPTFWINLKKSEVPGTVFENQNKLKVVSHCRESKKFYDRYLHREYLAYKTYNLLTEASFRVRLARIEYVYTDRRGRTTVRPAFLIEDADILAQRLGGTVVEKQIVPPQMLDTAALNLADVFQYMIGNTDFDFMTSVDECCHNAKVIAYPSRDGTFIPVPYDFDMTGIVNPPYARVDERLHVNRVTERVYRGIEAPREVIAATIQAYRLHKDEIMALWSTTPLLDDGRDRDEPVKFLTAFFKELDDPVAFADKLATHSRSREGTRRVLETKFSRAYKEWQVP